MISSVASLQITSTPPTPKGALASCNGSIQQVLDISLVNGPTFLAECLGQLAAEVRPLMIASTNYVLD